MEYIYFLTQLTQLTHAPFILYNKEKRQLMYREQSRQLSAEEQSRFEAVFQPKPGEYPSVLIMEELVLIQIQNQGREEEWIFAGPVIPGSVEEKAYNSICKKHKELAEWGFPIYMCSMKQLIAGVLALYWTMTGTELSSDQFWEKNREQFASVKQIFSRMTKDIFDHQENRGPHNPFEQEQRELDSIRNGDPDALKNSMAETYEGELGILAKNPLRHHKNVAIGNITLASRAAIQGGLNAEQSFSMADSLIRQVEEIGNVPEVEAFKREAKMAYAQTVMSEKKSTGGVKNPLITGVKDYIFSHLHSAIHVSDIAKHLKVNPDYLSHLFREEEHETIKHYIFREKIKRSQNLLRYSGYRIQDIGFYLGFSSQSHFTRIFREIVGMSPNEYRKQFQNRETWEIL